jgi:hypothetical protein
MKFSRMFVRSSIVAVLLLPLVASTLVVRAQSADSAEISQLLVDAKSHAGSLQDDAATLNSFVRSKLHWKSHAGKLSAMRTHVNELGQINQKLADLRVTGSPWQQTAIEQIDPLLREMANHLNATINHLNDNQSRIHMREYRDYVHASHELASRTAGMIRDFVDYDEAKSKADTLEAKLELPSDDKVAD